ncbi:MAG: type II toxin-antitoxin system HicB family antitoxin [Candidatus Atribacteria bacterium]|nr:type II toxin-antitoxin system HicB family antitoxin [Candidatus Atribacteria bacterium]MCD6349190.1 type II toxin-antitoxin system HicB family antitoxin [Candidatus Atribacteria bacterium]
MRKFTVVVEKGEQEYIGHVIELPGCHTQGLTVDELMANIKEAIELYLEAVGGDVAPVEIVDVRTVEV